MKLKSALMSPVGTCWELWGEASAGTPPRAASALGISNHSNATGQSPENTLHLETHTLYLSLWYHAAWLMHIELLQLSGNSQILTKSLLNCLVFALNGVMIDCNADTWRFGTTLNAPTLFSSLQSLSFELQKSVFVNAKPDPRIHKLFSLWATFKNCEATWVSIQNDVLYSNDALFIIISCMCII